MSTNKTDDIAPAELPVRGVLRGDQGMDFAQSAMAGFVVAVFALLTGMAQLWIPLQGRDLTWLLEETALQRIVTWPEALDWAPASPATLFGIAVNYTLAGNGVIGLHLVSIFLHLFSSVFIAMLSRQLLPRESSPLPAMLVGLLFAINPWAFPHTAEIVARAPVQAAFFAFAALLALLQAQNTDRLRPGWLGLATVLTTLALASHLWSAPLLALWLLIFALRKRRLDVALLLPAAALGLCVAAYFAAATAEHTKLGSPEGVPYYAAGLLLPLAAAILNRIALAPLRLTLGIAAGIAALAGAWHYYTQAVERWDPATRYTALLAANPQDTLSAAFLAAHYVNEARRGPESENRQALYEAAIPLLESLTVQPQASTRQLLYLAEARLATGASEAALAAAQAALRDVPDSPEGARLAALAADDAARQSGNTEMARTALDYYALAHRHEALPRPMLARFAMLNAGAGRPDRAYALLREAAGDPPAEELKPLLQQYGLLQQARAKAETALQELAQSKPGDIGVLIGQAQLYLMDDKALSAFYLLDRVLARAADNREAWTAMGFASARLERTQGFLAEYGAQQQDAAAWNTLAARCAAANAWPAAETYLAHAFTAGLLPQRPKIALAGIARELRQPERATAILRAAADETPDAPEPWLGLAELALLQDRKQDAANFAREAEKRAADPAALEKLKAQLGDAALPPPAPASGPVRTIIQ